MAFDYNTTNTFGNLSVDQILDWMNRTAVPSPELVNAGVNEAKSFLGTKEGNLRRNYLAQGLTDQGTGMVSANIARATEADVNRVAQMRAQADADAKRAQLGVLSTALNQSNATRAYNANQTQQAWGNAQTEKQTAEAKAQADRLFGFNTEQAAFSKSMTLENLALRKAQDALNNARTAEEFAFRKEQARVAWDNAARAEEFQKKQADINQENWMKSYLQNQSQWGRTFEEQQKQSAQNQSQWGRTFEEQQKQNALGQSNWEQQFAANENRYNNPPGQILKAGGLLRGITPEPGRYRGIEDDRGPVDGSYDTGDSGSYETGDRYGEYDEYA